MLLFLSKHRFYSTAEVVFLDISDKRYLEKNQPMESRLLRMWGGSVFDLVITFQMNQRNIEAFAAQPSKMFLVFW